MIILYKIAILWKHPLEIILIRNISLKALHKKSFLNEC